MTTITSRAFHRQINHSSHLFGKNGLGGPSEMEVAGKQYHHKDTMCAALVASATTVLAAVEVVSW